MHRAIGSRERHKKEFDMLEPRKGDRVSWKSHGGTARGKVVRKVTVPTMIKGHKAMASKENPEFLVETDEGKRAVHKAEALGKD